MKTSQFRTHWIPSLGAPLLTLLMATSRPAPASPAYFSGTGHWYEAVKVPAGLTWNEGFTNAVNRGGYLCTITSAAENLFVAGLVDAGYYSDLSITNDILGPWLGGFRHAGETNWQWLTGEMFSYTAWYANQPDGYGGSEQRLQFYHGATIGSTWGDHPGDPIYGYSLPRGYIVEYDQQLQLTAVRSNAVTVISWSQPAPGWLLETTPSLPADPGAWSLVSSNEYQSNPVSFFITATNRAGSAFYRLRHQ
jgi:hypothetical protein